MVLNVGADCHDESSYVCVGDTRSIPLKFNVMYSRLSSECTPRSSRQQVSHMNHTPLSSVDFHRILIAIRSCLGSFMAYTEHGPSLRHTDIDTIFKQFGASVNIHNTTLLMEQLAAIHAIWTAVANRDAALLHKELIYRIDEMLQCLGNDGSTD